MKTKVILYLIGIVVLAVAVGLMWLAVGMLPQQEVFGVILFIVAMLGVTWVGGKGWDTSNPFIEHYKMGFVFIVAWIPILDLIVPYWVGLGFARLTGLGGRIESAMMAKAGYNPQRAPLDTLLKFMVTSTSEALESGDYQTAIDTATEHIVLVEQQAKKSPDLSSVYDRCLVELYGLRAEARHAQSEQTDSAEQLDLARQDAQKVQSFIASLSGTGDESKLRELENRIRRVSQIQS